MDLQNNRHIYSNILSQYKFDQEKFNYHYSVKEFALLAIAANDKLAERCQDILFAEGNLSLLPLFVGGQKYIEAFIEKFHSTDGVYGRLKDQATQLVEPNKIDFFSVIALRKEQELLNAVFVEYVLRDLEQVLKTSKPDPLYGVLETASLIKNEKFITIVLGAFERYINEPTKKASTEELLKKSFATLLETAISQEHISIIECLCKQYTNSADRAIYDVYEQAFADDKVIIILKQQILRNIKARGRKEIYDLILKTALGAGNIAFIERLCKECAKCSNDVINYLDHKLKNNEFDETYESILIALFNVEGASAVINEPSVLSQVVDGKNNSQLSSQKSKSTDSQQPQENIVDKRENIMDNRGGSTEELISNSFKESEMGKNSAKKRKERIKLSKEKKKKNEQEKEVQFRELYVGKNDGSKVITEVDSSKKKQAPGQLAGCVEQTGGLGSSNDNNPLDNGTNGERNSTFKTDEQDTKPAPILEPVPSVANNKSEQVNDTQTNGGLPNNSGKNNAIPQNTKSSKLPAIAASALVIAGIISGVAVAVYLEMLAVGIAVGACCLVAAAVIYYCTPKSSVENSNVETVKTAELTAQ